jgi:small conductance mechanosensitive channel
MSKPVTQLILLSAFVFSLFSGNAFFGHFACRSALARTEKQSTASPEKDVGEKNKEEAKKEKVTPEEESPSEKIVRIYSGIESAKKELAQLKAELKTRMEAFAKAGFALKDVTDQLNGKKEALKEVQGEPASPDAEKLKTEIEQLEKEYALAKKDSDLALEAEKTVREQVKTLEEKIERDTKTLERLVGQEEEVPKTAPATPKAPTKKAEEPAKPAPAVTPPGLPISSDTQKQPDEEEKELEFLQTPEQIEARRQAEKKVKEAQKAASAIVDFVERKSALEKQINLEQKMVQTAEANQANLEQQLKERQKLLTEKISAGAPKKELNTLQLEIVKIRDKMTKVSEELRTRHERLENYNSELQAIQEEEIHAVKEAERKRKEAEAARKKSLWLESPFHPKNLQKWVATRGPRLLITLFVMAVLLLIVRVFSKNVSQLILRHGFGSQEAREKRVKTLDSTFRGTLGGLIVIIGLLILLQEAGMDIKALLGGAAVIGLAIAFGAQSLMKDYFNGFMILLEGQYQLNDWIQIGEVSGAVERITLRITTLRDLEGRVHFIPNGQIARVTNMTHEWAQVLLDIGVAYKEDPDRVMALLMDIATEIRKDSNFGLSITGEPVMLGVNLFGESGIVIRMLMKTRAGSQWAVRREMLRRIKNKFDEEGIEIPVPHRVIFQRNEAAKSGSEPLHDPDSAERES